MLRLIAGCAVLAVVCLSARAQTAPPPAPGVKDAPAARPAGADAGADEAKDEGKDEAKDEGKDEAKGGAGAAEGQDGARDEPGAARRVPAEFGRGGFGRPAAPPPFFRDAEADEAAPAPDPPPGFRWKSALRQSLLMLSIQHGYALTQPKTRRELRGPFLKDYFRSLRNLGGWDDGGRFFTNYVAHPLQGATAGFIQVQNDPRGVRQQFGRSRAYWRSRMKALAWSAATSTQFELGPISQASIGNVGSARKLTYVDLVVTPTAGTALLVAEDALDRFVVRRIESASGNSLLRVAARMLLNPSRSCANLLRFKKPWHRDTR